MSFDEEDDSELNCTLWVGNLDSQVNENTLLELFTQFQVGPIEKIHFPKGKDGTGHKGYCFIQFLHDESVPYTMNVMEGTSLFGKLLRLQPRPNSKHRKLMDQRETEQRQLQMAQQQQQPQQQQQQWFISPQMGQFQGMLVYPNHPAMFQQYAAATGLPGVGVTNGMPLQFSPGMGLPMMQIPIQPAPQEVQHIRLPRNSEFRQPRPPAQRAPMTNGYSSNGVNRSPGGNAQPSHYNSQSQVLNGSQSRFSHNTTRGARPNAHRPPHSNYLQNGPRNGNNNNGNGRMPFTPRPALTNYPQAPQIYASPVYHSPPPQYTAIQYQNDQQFYRRQPQGQLQSHPHTQPHPAAGIVAFPTANGANMFHQQQY